MGENKKRVDSRIIENATGEELQTVKYQFISVRNRFDYMNWQIGLWTDKNIKEIGKVSMMHLVHKNYELEVQ